MKTLAFALVIAASAPAFALDRLPLDQLKPGKWEVERTIRKPGEAPTIRKTDYCASPKKEISRALSIASFLCKSEIKQVTDKQFDITAQCNLPGGLAGTNHTVITLHDATHYTIETESKGTKFGGVPAERSETIKATRAGECEDKPAPPSSASTS
jgi:Protein of unknown function (DUF3617)